MRTYPCLHVAPQGVEEAKQAVLGESVQSTPIEIRDDGLRCAQDFGRPGLCEASRFDDRGNHAARRALARSSAASERLKSHPDRGGEAGRQSPPCSFASSMCSDLSRDPGVMLAKGEPEIPPHSAPRS